MIRTYILALLFILLCLTACNEEKDRPVGSGDGVNVLNSNGVGYGGTLKVRMLAFMGSDTLNKIPVNATNFQVVHSPISELEVSLNGYVRVPFDPALNGERLSIEVSAETSRGLVLVEVELYFFADVNRDRVVNCLDLDFFRRNIAKPIIEEEGIDLDGDGVFEEVNYLCDTNRDGYIDLVDLVEFRADWREACPGH